MSSKALQQPARRRFIALGAGAGIAATAAVVAPSVTSPTSPARSDKRAGKGYQETAHVRNYYRTTQV